MNIAIRREEERDFRQVEHLTREAFWDVYRPGCCEHLLAHKLRKTAAFVRELSLVACDGDTLVGDIMYSKAKVVNAAGGEREVLCMGPLSVLPSYQKKGVGSLLVKRSIELAREMGFRAVIIFGSPEYYHRFGFVNARNYGITTSTGENFEPFMALELSAGALGGVSGKFHEDEVFQVKDEELDAFDRDFPHREKHVTDTQFK